MSLARKKLTDDIKKLLCDRATSSGVTLAKVLQSGLLHEDSEVGLYAGDAQCYHVFAPLFDSAIESLLESLMESFAESSIESVMVALMGSFTGSVMESLR